MIRELFVWGKCVTFNYFREKTKIHKRNSRQVARAPPPSPTPFSLPPLYIYVTQWGPQGIPRLLPIREGESLENWRGQNVLWPRRRLADRVRRSWKQVLVAAKKNFKLLYSTLLYLPPLRYPGIVGCWDRTLCCQFSCFFLPCSLLWPQDTRRTRIRNAQYSYHIQ
jgi:hypothetical protein